MFRSELKDHNIYIASLTSPRNETDPESFFAFLDNLVTKESFIFVFESEGEVSFDQDNKKKMSSWFKAQKQYLASHCLAIARVKKDDSAKARLATEAMRNAIPCPYEVFNTMDSAINWAKDIKKGSL